MINLFGIFFTAGLFKIVQKYNKIPILKSISPILTTGILIIILLKIFNIETQKYIESTSYLTFLLIPATISLGYPLYENFHLLTKNKRITYFAFLFATIFALSITFITAKICNSDLNIIVSLLPKSVTAPIAIEISKNMEGIPELTACVVVLTGVWGGVFGHKILKLLKVKNNIAIGLAIGAASHVIGTSKCIEKGNKKQIVMSTLALVIVGILTVVFAPVIFKIFC